MKNSDILYFDTNTLKLKVDWKIFECDGHKLV